MPRTITNQANMIGPKIPPIKPGPRRCTKANQHHDGDWDHYGRQLTPAEEPMKSTLHLAAGLFMVGGVASGFGTCWQEGRCSTLLGLKMKLERATQLLETMRDEL